MTCDHSESLYGRCTSCGKTWEEQVRLRRNGIDRQELIVVLDQFGVLPAERHTWPEVLAFRESLADAILALETPLVTDTGTMIVEYPHA